MIHSPSTKVTEVIKGSPAESAGIRKGDRIKRLNSEQICDEIDLAFYSQEERLEVMLDRNGRNLKLIVKKEEYEPLGISLEPLKIGRCRNKCIFCFVDQLPAGLRRSLYIKDEDYRFSFLYGNYVTLSNLSDADMDRIIRQRLSPLYISVHSTDPGLRSKMLGNRQPSDIMSELRELNSNGISYHTQIVLCPGYNDGEELKRTIKDLSSLYPGLMSIAVVPVGLTSHRNKELRPVTEADAREAIDIVESFQRSFVESYGERVVYGSDELYIKASAPFPGHDSYGDFPQIENGVGMVPDFIQRSKYIRMSSYKFSRKRFITVTGTSFYPYLLRYIKKIVKRTGVGLDLIKVFNDLFGRSVTVAGLLTGRDIIRQLSAYKGKYDIILLPDVLLKDSADILLDDVRAKDIGKNLNADIRIISSDPKGLLNGLEEKYEY